MVKKIKKLLFIQSAFLKKGGIMQVMQGFAQEAKKVVQAMIVLYSAEVI